MSEQGARPAATAGVMTAAAVVYALAAIYLPMLTMMGMLWPVFIALVTVREGLRWGVLAAAASLLLTILFATPMTGAFFVLSFAPTGLVLGVLFRRRTDTVRALVGGALASLVGTLELLDAEERALIKGLVINKFRGDVTLLTPALDFLEKKTGKPVLGVVPHIEQLGIDEEDSVSLDEKRYGDTSARDDQLKIAVIRTPKLSNFTDFDALAGELDVALYYVTTPDELGSPDLILLPGSKNTTEDLLYIRETGLETAIRERVTAGTPLFGICGGYQMLGGVVRDPLHTESEHDETAGFAYLPSETTFAAQKRLRQVTASADFSFLGAHISGRNLLGYEIHMGQTDFLEKTIRPFHIAQEDNFVSDGAVSSDGLVIGTYIHGIFDDDDFRRSLLNRLQYRYSEEKERFYNRLSETVRKSLDMERLRAIVEGDQ